MLEVVTNFSLLHITICTRHSIHRQVVNSKTNIALNENSHTNTIALNEKEKKSTRFGEV